MSGAKDLIPRVPATDTRENLQLFAAQNGETEMVLRQPLRLVMRF